MRVMPGRSPREAYRPERANSSTVARNANWNSGSIAVAWLRGFQSSLSKPALSKSAVSSAM